MTNYLSSIELVLYYCCTLVVCSRVKGNSIRKNRVILSLLAFIPMPMIIFFRQDLNLAVTGVYSVISVLLNRWTAKSSSFGTIIYCHLFLSFFSMLLYSIVHGILGITETVVWEIELTTNLFTAGTILLLCCSSLQERFRLASLWTPRYLKILLLSLLTVSSLLSLFVVQKPTELEPLSLALASRYLYIILILLYLAIVPIVVLYAMTNRLLKNQTRAFQQQLEIQSEFYSRLAEADMTLRRFRHDYKNIQIGMKSLLQEGKNEEALSMLDAPPAGWENAPRFDTGSGIVDAILQDKQQRARACNTTITFTGAVPDGAVKPLDLCILFGHTLDNAVEACETIENDIQKEIHLRCECNSGFAYVEITNPVKNRVEIQNGLPKTTKKDKELHGFGLYSLRQVIKQYHGTLSFSCDDSLFRLTMEFQLPPKSI